MILIDWRIEILKIQPGKFKFTQGEKLTLLTQAQMKKLKIGPTV